MRVSLVSALLLAVLAGQAQAQIYQTYGAHNAPEDSPCAVEGCVYPRNPGDPPDPVWPEYWQSDWTMYRVYNRYQDYPPPYPAKPPAALVEGIDYEVSYGATFYDSTWRSGSGEGAMMERYDNFCLPIFPLPNNYSCAFVSLGDTAYFIAGDDRPSWMPHICLFSPKNHPPRRDFISHLPYSAADSARIGTGGQGYSFWVSAANGYVIQIGASPDRTADGAILFGYGFQANSDGEVLPQSFYFSGYPLAPANAPIVSQNYTNFSATQPPPETWAEVAGLDPDTLPRCQLFDPPASAQATVTGEVSSAEGAKRAPTWGDIGRWKP
jgi:hypothetical protein